MALADPDMSSCSPKRVCLTGENEGVAYDPDKPCDLGLSFSLLTCNCEASYGWVYAKTVSTGYCYEFSGTIDPQCCGGSSITSTSYRYVLTWSSGPTPAVGYETNTHWVGDGNEDSGALYPGQSVSARLDPAINATSQNIPWYAPFAMGGVSGNGDACSLPFVNCGAINRGGCSSSSTLSIGSYLHDPMECDCSDLDLSDNFDKSQCIARCVG